MSRAPHGGRQARSRDRGSILIPALTLALMVGALTVALLANVNAEIKSSQAAGDRKQARALAEGGMEVAARQIIDTLALGNPVPSSGLASIWMRQPSGTLATQSVPFTVTPYMASQLTMDGDGYPAYLEGYKLRTNATMDTATDGAETILQLRQVPLFSYLAFYEGDLEMRPALTTTYAGRIHTNGNLYLGAGQTLTLQMRSLEVVGGVYRRDRATGQPSGGTVRIDAVDKGRVFDLESKAQFDLQGVPSVSGMDSDFPGYDANQDGDFGDWWLGDKKPWTPEVLMRWRWEVIANEHGARRYGAPGLPLIQAFVPASGGDYIQQGGGFVPVPPGTGTHTKGELHRDAGIVIQNGIARDASGQIVAPPPGAVTLDTIWDAREGQTVPVRTIDLSLLAGSPAWPANGLLYVAETPSTPSSLRGVQLVNGASLAAPLSVATENPLYLRGPYNTVAPVGAAVFCDALNLLSSAWDGSKAPGTGVPAAATTAYNLALVAGDTDGSTTFNGGFENLVRLHENWTGRELEITGSLVCLFESAQAQGAFQQGNGVFYPPKFEPKFDNQFLQVANLPPHTPNVSLASTVAWRDI